LEGEKKGGICWGPSAIQKQLKRRKRGRACETRGRGGNVLMMGKVTWKKGKGGGDHSPIYPSEEKIILGRKRGGESFYGSRPNSG